MAVGWGYTNYWAGILPVELQAVKVQPVAPEECMAAWRTELGYNPIDPNSMLCMQPPLAGTPMGTCNGDSGGPLLAPFPDSKTGWLQIGITSWGAIGCEAPLPEMYTRVSEMLQWILGPSALGMFPAKALRLTLSELSIPDGATVAVYKGMAGVESMLLDRLDSACDAGMTYSDEGEGGLLLVLHTPPLVSLNRSSEGACDLECLQAQGLRGELEALGCADNFQAAGSDSGAGRPWGSGGAMGSGSMSGGSMGGLHATLQDECSQPLAGGVEGCELVQGTCQPPTCQLKHVRWENITAMARVGKAATGGLGMQAVKRFHEVLTPPT